MNASRSWHERRARRMLVWGALAFFGIQFAIGLTLDYGVPLLRFPSARTVLERLQEDNVAPVLVILGSSRASGAFHERETKTTLERGAGLTREARVLNAAVPAGDPVAQERVLQSILATGARPRLVLVEVSPEFFNGFNFCEVFNVERLIRWSDLPEHTRSAFASGQLGRLLAGRIAPGYQYRERLWELAAVRGPLHAPALRFEFPREITPVSTPVPDSSAAIPPTTPEVVALMAKGRLLLRDNWLRRYRVSPVNVAAVKRIARRCRDAGCELILFSPPVTSGHRSAYTPEIEDAYQQTLAEIGCRHVDCRDWLADGYFYDMHHVTPAGGVEFSRQFARRVLVPCWKR